MQNVCGEMSPDMEKAVVKNLVKNFNSIENKHHGNKMLSSFHSNICEENWLESSGVTIREFLMRAQRVQSFLAQTIAQAQNMGFSDTGERNNSSRGSQNTKGKPFKSASKTLQTMSSASSTKGKTAQLESCWGCGMNNHKKPDCLHKDHPDFNRESKPWKDSLKGKAWIRSGARHYTTAKSAVDALVHHTGIFGVPLQITSDKGSQFVNSLISEFNAIGGAEQQIATAYSKEESAIIERSNKETGRHLRNFLFNNFIKEKWGMRLPLIARIHNTQVHESTGVAPYKLVLNNALRLEKNIFSDNLDHILVKRPPTADGLITSGVGSWAADQLRAQAILLEIAELNLRNKDLKHINATVTSRSDEGRTAEKKSKNSKDSKQRIAEFPINSYVLLDYPKSKYHAGPERKILAWKSGPFRVVDFVGNDYTIVDLLTDTEKIVHISRLSPFYYDKAYTIPYDVANANKGYFEVEKIIKAEGHVDNKTKLSFLVRWKGFDESKDSYVSHKDLVWNSSYYNWCKDQLKIFEHTLYNIQHKTHDWQNLTTAQIQNETKRYRKIHNILESDIKRFENDMNKTNNNSISCLIDD